MNCFEIASGPKVKPGISMERLAGVRLDENLLVPLDGEIDQLPLGTRAASILFQGCLTDDGQIAFKREPPDETLVLLDSRCPTLAEQEPDFEICAHGSAQYVAGGPFVADSECLPGGTALFRSGRKVLISLKPGSSLRLTWTLAGPSIRLSDWMRALSGASNDEGIRSFSTTVSVEGGLPAIN